MYKETKKFKVKELIEKLQQFDPEADVWMTVRNNAGAYTYARIDYVNSYKFGDIFNDFYGTPGHTDMRVFNNAQDEDNVVVIDSAFEHITVS